MIKKLMMLGGFIWVFAAVGMNDINIFEKEDGKSDITVKDLNEEQEIKLQKKGKKLQKGGFGSAKQYFDKMRRAATKTIDSFASIKFKHEVLKEKSKKLAGPFNKIKDAQKVQFIFKNGESTRLDRSVVEQSKTLAYLLETLDQSDTSYSINIPEQYSKKIFDACFGIGPKLDGSEIESFVDCYFRYLDLPNDAQFFQENVTGFLSVNPDRVIGLKGKVFCYPFVDKKYTSLTFNNNKIASVFYHSLTKKFFLCDADTDDNKEPRYYEIQRIDTTPQLFENELSQSGKATFLRPQYSSDEQIVFVDLEFVSGFLIRTCNIYNYIRISGNSYDLMIKNYTTKRPNQTLEGLLENMKRTGTDDEEVNDYREMNFFVITKDLHQKVSKIFNFSQTKYWCRDFVTDGVNLFLLAQEKDPSSQQKKLFAYTFQINDNNVSLVGPNNIVIEDINNVTSLGLCQKLDYLVLGYDTGTLKFYDIKKGQLYECKTMKWDDPIRYIAVNEDQKLLAITTEKGCFFHKFFIIKSKGEEEITIKTPEKEKSFYVFTEKFRSEASHDYCFDKNEGTDDFLVYNCQNNNLFAALVYDNGTWERKTSPLNLNNDSYIPVNGWVRTKDFDAFGTVNWNNKEKNCSFTYMLTNGLFINGETIDNKDLILMAKAVGKSIIDECSDGENFFLLTNWNEILHFVISFNHGKGVVSFIKKYDISTKRKVITKIAYSIKYNCLILGFKDGTLKVLDLDNPDNIFSIAITSSSNFDGPILDIIFNRDESHILIESKGKDKNKYSIYEVEQKTNKTEQKTLLKEPPLLTIKDFLQGGVILAGIYALYKYFTAPKKGAIYSKEE